MDNSFAGQAMVKPGETEQIFCLGYKDAEIEASTHEFTHAVVNACVYPRLDYSGEAGVIHEALADSFAMLHKIKKFQGTTKDQRWFFDGIRHLAEPHRVTARYDDRQYPYPEYYMEPGCWYSGKDESSFVHHNSTALSKMTYLLCDGDTFNNITVKGIGVDKTLQLYWMLISTQKMTQTQTLSNFAELLLTTAAFDCGFTADEQQNLINACRAVKLPNSDALRVISPQSRQMAFFVNEQPGNGGKYQVNGKAVDLKKMRIAGIDSFKNLFDNGTVYQPTLRRFLKNSGGSAANIVYKTLQQINGVEVYGASATVQTDVHGNIKYFSKSFADVDKRLNVSKTTVLPQDIRNRLLGNIKNNKIVQVTPVIYAPELMGRRGNHVAAWKVDVAAGNILDHCYLVDQNSGKILYSIPLTSKSNK